MVQGAPVRVSGLVANYWQMDDRHGISFRAARIEPATPTAASNGAAATAGKLAA